MITASQVKRYLKPGDEVFIIDERQVVGQRIKKILADSLAVEDGFLHFDDHGYTWRLTQRVAKENRK